MPCNGPFKKKRQVVGLSLFQFYRDGPDVSKMTHLEPIVKLYGLANLFSKMIIFPRLFTFHHSIKSVCSLYNK